MENLIYLFFIAIIILSIKNSTSRNDIREDKSSQIYNYGRKDYLMTKSEHNFFQILNEIFQEQYHIFPQMHLSSILDQRKVKGQNWNAAFRHINGKSVDFVLCDKQYARPVVAIELDDWTHDRETRQTRDKEVERIFEAAKMPLVRFSNYEKLSSSEIKSKINETLSSVS